MKAQAYAKSGDPSSQYVTTAAYNRIYEHEQYSVNKYCDARGSGANLLLLPHFILQVATVLHLALCVL